MPSEQGSSSEAKNEEVKEPETQKGMRAVVLNGFGALKNVKVVQKPEPCVADGEVLIRVQLCGINFQDIMVRQGLTDSPQRTPFILGFECAGIVEAVGAGVQEFKVGDRVVALPECKAWAELTAVPAKYVYAVPEAMPLQEAAALTLSYAVAYMLVHQLAHVAKGQTVLLHSAGGAVGQAICALCKNIGDVTLIGVSSKNKHETIMDSVTHLIEREGDVCAEVRKLCPDGVDVVLDCLGGEECSRSYGFLKPLGRYILYGSSSTVTGETRSIFTAAKSPGGVEHVKDVVKTVYGLWEKRVAKAVIDSTYALEDVCDAMTKIHERINVGKLLLDLSMEPKARLNATIKAKKEDKKENGEKVDDAE